MIVALPMYDWPEVRPFTEKYWSLIRHHLRAAGFEVPEDLTEPEDYFAHWRDPDLLLSQTCGLPFSAKLSGHVSLIGPVDHGLTGCAPGEYQSHVIIRADEDATSVEDLRGRRFGFNSRDSQSGHAAFVAAFGSPDALFGEMVETGGHRASVLAVAEGRADAAAIDAVGWQLAMAHEPAAKGLPILASTPPTPALPYISAKRPEAEVEKIRAALDAAIADLGAEAQKALHIFGLQRRTEADYTPLAAGWPASLG